jgi:hypothetical protein
MAEAVNASETTVGDLFGFGPVGTSIAVGHARDVRRFSSRDHFAAYNGIAPIEVSSGGRNTHRLSRRGNRQLNHAIHMAAITQIRHSHSPGYAYYQRKRAEGKTTKEAIRALKRRISDALYERLIADEQRRAREGKRGRRHKPTRATSNPDSRPFRKATPGPATNVEAAAPTRPRNHQHARADRPKPRLDNKEEFDLSPPR